MKIGVKILPRNEVLDAQGRAVENTLKRHDFRVQHCRVGKFIQLELAEVDEARALAQAKKIAQFVLHNPLIETFELEVLK